MLRLSQRRSESASSKDESCAKERKETHSRRFVNDLNVELSRAARRSEPLICLLVCVEHWLELDSAEEKIVSHVVSRLTGNERRSSKIS